MTAINSAGCAAADDMAASPRLTVSGRTGDASLIEEIAEEWRALCEEGARNEPFYRPEWTTAYLHAFAPDARMLLLTVRAGSHLRAVLPLVRRSDLFCGIPARVLESPSNVHSVRFDLVHGNGDGDAAVACLWERLKEQSDWDVLVMNDVPEGGAAEQLLRLAAREGWPVGQWETNCSPFVPMVGITDPLALAQRGHFRANLRRRLRKASATWPVSLERTADAEPHALAEFYAIEASGWKGQEGTAITCSPATRRFYDEVARAAAAFGYLSLYILRFGRQAVAGHFGLFYNGRYYTPKVGFDEQYAAFSPGHLIVDAVLRDSLSRGIVEFEFLGSSMPWKLEWTSQVRPHSHCYVFRKSAVGRTLYLAKFEVMARLRPLVHRGRAVLSPAERR